MDWHVRQRGLDEILSVALFMAVVDLGIHVLLWSWMLMSFVSQ